jgi:hypothetical protein
MNTVMVAGPAEPAAGAATTVADVQRYLTAPSAEPDG